MTDPAMPVDWDLEPDGNAARTRLSWDVPEVAVAAVLLVVGVLAIGGLVTGIWVIVQAIPAAGDLSPSGVAIELSTQWASPLLTMALLGVMGICWWQATAWQEAVSNVGSAGGDFTEALRRSRRWLHTSWWTLGAVLVTLAASVGGLVGVLMQRLQGLDDALPVAELVAVTLLTGTALWIGRRIWLADTETLPEPADFARNLEP